MKCLRPGAALLLGIALLLAGCANTQQATNGGSQSSTGSYASPYTAYRSKTPEVRASVGTKKLLTPDSIIAQMCGNIEYELSTHEFPDIWEPNSETTRLAAEYHRASPDSDLQLMLTK